MNATNDPHAQSDDIAKLAGLIKDVRIAMLTTVDDEGRLRSRPMATQQAPFDGTLWFFTEKATPKVDEVRQEANVNVVYAAPDDNRYVSVSGRARLVTDRQKIDELWHPVLKAWFPEGKDDPNLALLRVEVEKAEYWDSPSSKVVQLFGFAKALATGRRYEGEGSEHEKLEL